MRTFEEWLQDEGLMRNIALGGALLGAGFGASKMLNKPQQPNVQQTKQLSQPNVQPDEQSDLFILNDIAKGKYGKGENGWNDRLGNFTYYDTPIGVIYWARGDFYKRSRVAHFNTNLYQKFDIDTGQWGRKTGITDYVRKTWQRD